MSSIKDDDIVKVVDKKIKNDDDDLGNTHTDFQVKVSDTGSNSHTTPMGYYTSSQSQT